jgi:hypothetical protein
VDSGVRRNDGVISCGLLDLFPAEAARKAFWSKHQMHLVWLSKISDHNILNHFLVDPLGSPRCFNFDRYFVLFA